MHRLVFIALAAAALPACPLDAGGTPYEITVDWTTAGTSSENVTARITYDDEEIITHGTLASRGHTGTALVSGETYGDSFEVCVELGTYKLVTEYSGYGCESGDYECDETTTSQFVAKSHRCAIVTPDDTHVALTF